MDKYLTLLPIGSSKLEKLASKVLAEALKNPIIIPQLLNPNDCPVDYLPYLAWTLSVDSWDETWSETTKRNSIKASFFIHKHKGTIGAVRRVVEPLGYLIEVLEWWQAQPNEEPGTFRLKIGIAEQGITPEMISELYRLIDDAKPVSRHIKGLVLSLSTTGSLYVGSRIFLGDTLTIYPYVAEAIDFTNKINFSAITHIIDTMEIQPHGS